MPAVLTLKRDGAPQKRRVQKSSDSLRAMICKCVESDFTPGFTVQRRNLVQGKHIALGRVASVEVQHEHGLSVAPRRQILVVGGRGLELERRIHRELHGLRREQSRGLMMPVAAVHAAPAVNHNVGAKPADYSDHVLEDLIAPDPFRFFRRFRVAEIFRTRKVEPHAVAARRRQQFLRPNQS